MLKHFSFIVLLTVVCFTSSAQKNVMTLGFQGGAIINSANGSAVYKPTRGSYTGISAGVNFKIQTSAHVSFKAALSYEQNGWLNHDVVFENNNGVFLGSGNLYYKLNYLNLPLLVEYATGKKIKWTIDGGFFIGYLLSNKITAPSATAPTISSGNRKKINFGASVGTGVQVPIAHKTMLDFGVRNNFGLANIYKSSSATSASIKTNAFAITAGLSFKL